MKDYSTPKKDYSKPNPESIYSKGGAYEQFGPNPPVFNPVPGNVGGMVEAGADQPGSAMPFIGQMAGNIVGSAAGPIGAAGAGVVGNLTGEGIRQGVGKVLGYQDNADSGKQFMQSGKSAAIGEGIGLGLNTLGEIPGVKKFAGDTANNIMLNVMKLPKKIGTRNLDLGTEALRLGITGSREGMVDKANSVIADRGNQLNQILDANPDVPIDKNIMSGKLKQLSDFYNRTKAPELAEKVDELGGRFMSDFQEPKTVEDQQTTRFIIPQGSDSTLTYQEPSVKLSKNQGKTFYDPSTNQEIPTERGLRRTLLDRSEKKGSPGYVGGYTEPTVTQRTEYIDKPMGVKQAQQNKQEQYDLITGHLKSNPYYSNNNPAEIETRMLAGQGYKEGIEEALPQYPIRNLNADSGSAQTIRDAMGDEMTRHARMNQMSLEDNLLTGAGFANPKILGYEAAKKVGTSTPFRTGMAKALYGLSTRPNYANSVRRFIYPGVNSLISSAGRETDD